MIPILHDLLTDQAPGVRALLIYPMNALVNDQLLRLRKLLAGTPITFGRYTSELEERESQGKAKNPDAPDNEVISREKIRGNPGKGIPASPPQILITNYAMLEYLLLRPEDSPIFDTSRLRFLCLDEAHTYTGAQGIEVSMLLRRLKQRLGKRREEIQCIATSATLTENDRGAAASFASSLFGENFLEEDVIFGTPLDITTTGVATDPSPSVTSWLQISEGLRERLREAFGSEQRRNLELIEEAAQEFLKCELATADRIEAACAQAENGDIGRFLWAVFQPNPQLAQLRATMREVPVELRMAGRELFGGDDALDDAEGDSQRAEAVCRLVEIGAMARETSDSVPLLPARYHLFARAPQGAWLCLNLNCKNPEGDGWSRLYLEKREHCPDCSAAVYELTACRNCGQPYVRTFNRDGVFAAEGKFDRDTSGQRYFTWKPLTASDDDDEPDDSSDACETGPVEICLRCRRQSDDCKCVSDACHITLYQIRDARGNPRETLPSCPRCMARSAAGREIVTSIRVGNSAPLSVLTEELYRLSPPNPKPEIRSKSGEGRKLLTFADSRQGAARYAAYLQSTVERQACRKLRLAWLPRAVCAGRRKATSQSRCGKAHYGGILFAHGPSPFAVGARIGRM